MADITYCLNGFCPFKDCERHMNNVPGNRPVSMAYLDGTCRRYIGWLIDNNVEEAMMKEGADHEP